MIEWEKVVNVAPSGTPKKFVKFSYDLLEIVLDCISDCEGVGVWLKAVFEYEVYGECCEETWEAVCENRDAYACFRMARKDLDAMNAKWHSVCEQNQKNALERWK